MITTPAGIHISTVHSAALEVPHRCATCCQQALHRTIFCHCSACTSRFGMNWLHITCQRPNSIKHVCTCSSCLARGRTVALRCHPCAEDAADGLRRTHTGAPPGDWPSRNLGSHSCLAACTSGHLHALLLVVPPLPQSVLQLWVSCACTLACMPMCRLVLPMRRSCAQGWSSW